MIGMGELNANQELNNKQQTKTQSDRSNRSGNGKKAAKDTKETKRDEAAEQDQTCVVTYVAGGIWVDQNGAKWASESREGTNIKNIRKYKKQDYDKRHDLRFMVKYGSMTVTIV